MALAQKLLDAPVQITHSWGCMKILKRKKTDAVFSASVSLSKKLLAKRQRFSLPFVGQKEAGVWGDSPCWGRWHEVPEGLTDRPAPPRLKRSDQYAKSAKRGLGEKQEFFPQYFLMAQYHQKIKT